MPASVLSFTQENLGVPLAWCCVVVDVVLEKSTVKCA